MKGTLFNPLPMDAGVVVVLAGVTIGAWALLQPALSRTVDEARAQQALVKERRSASELSRTLAMVQTDLRVTRRELEEYTQTCWTDLDRSRRIEKLYTLAHDAGVNVDAIEPGEMEQTSGRRGLVLRMTARGPFTPISAMLHGLRSGNPDMVLRSVELGPTPNSEQDVNAMIEVLWVLPVENTAEKPAGSSGAGGTGAAGSGGASASTR